MPRFERPRWNTDRRRFRRLRTLSDARWRTTRLKSVSRGQTGGDDRSGAEQLDRIAVRILQHRDPDAGPGFTQRDGKGMALRLQPLHHAGQVLDADREVADARLAFALARTGRR